MPGSDVVPETLLSASLFWGPMTELVFLGTGGGRFATFLQPRATGGMYLRDGVNIHVDPGPGASWQMRRFKLDPTRTNGILVSHCHPDHYAEAENLIEGMCRGGMEKTGTVAGAESVFATTQNVGPAISPYHLAKPDRVVPMGVGDTLDIGGVKVRATPANHSDPSTVGFLLKTSQGDVGYVADTALSHDVIRANMGARVLVVPMTRPRGARIPHHLCTEDAAELIAGVDPELAVLNHLGMKVINGSPEDEAKWITDEIGVRTVAGRDGMMVDVGSGRVR